MTSQSRLPPYPSAHQGRGTNGSCRRLGNPGLRIQENGLSSTDSVATNKFFSSWMYWMLEESVWTRNTWTCGRTTKSGQLLFSPLKNLHAEISPCGKQWYTPLPLGGECRIMLANSHPKVIRCGNGGSRRSRIPCFTSKGR